MSDKVYCAIGDVHGEADKMVRLHELILSNHEIKYPGQPLIIVHLGDYIDRGPKSYDVVQHLMDMENITPASCINLRGNHEQMMLDAYQSDSPQYHSWLNSGGAQTLSSYRLNGFEEPPASHLKWMQNLKTFHWDVAAKLIFVHAGIDPANFPNDGKQHHLWTRSKQFFETENWGDTLPQGTKVIHGHTPTQTGLPDIDGAYRRVNIDTGACYGGDLSAVILAPHETPRFLTS